MAATDPVRIRLTRPNGPKEWECRRATIEDLYWNEDMELREVMKEMKESHGFLAT